jgi:hypothetical protein
MSRFARRLATTEWWQLALFLVLLGVATAVVLWELIRLIAQLRIVVSVVGALACVAWALLAIERRRRAINDEWVA